MLRRLFCTCAFVATPVLAQTAQTPTPLKPSHLQGQVVDSTGHPVRSAIVETDDPPRATISDENGFFRFSELPAGPITVRVRRIGFSGTEFQLRLPTDSTVSIGVKLFPAAQVLEAVHVDAGAEAAHPQLAETGFYQRMRAGWGHMVTPEEIDKRRKSVPTASSFLQDIVGVKVSHGQGGGGRRGNGGGTGALILGKSPKGTDCMMNLIMNGQPVKLAAGETFDQFVSANEVYAIEVYSHAAEIPGEYQQLLGTDFCGAVVVWTISKMTLKP